MNIYKKLGHVAAMASLLIGVGCTQHVSRDISSEGMAGEIVFPGTDKLVLKEGTFPTVEALSQIGSGVTKDQLYALIGRPHFREGFYGVNEWDYLFHFRDGATVTTCQFKVIFDSSYHGRSFHWLPADCGNRLAATPAAAVAPTQPQVKRFELSADALFAFGRSSLTDILPWGREELVSIAPQLIAMNATTVRVIGHTDYIGSDSSNQLLSQRRAETVRSFLVSQGVSPSMIVADGVGESQPVKSCSDRLDRASLVACLQPNRRVEIVVGGMH